MRQKKVGLVTLNGYVNYGNVLQNLALQQFLASKQIQTETIWYSDVDPDMTILNKAFQRIKDGSFFRSLYYKIQKLSSRSQSLKSRLMEQRESTFKNFVNQKIHYSETKLNKANINDKGLSQKLNGEYATFLVGSDQVWGIMDNQFADVYFLPFAEKTKRNSFAASFGFSALPSSNMIQKYSNALNQMNKISVREFEGKTLVADMSRRTDVEVLLDPTLLLSQEQWLKVASSEVASEGRYLLTYFLGEIADYQAQIIQTLCRDYGLRLIQLNAVESPELFSCSPAEFIRYFANSDYVVTDSFHGTVFSLIFKKRFIVLNRTGNKINMNSRITTLLKRAGLPERFVSTDSDFQKLIKTDTVDFSQFDQVVKKNYLQSEKFMGEVMAQVKN